MKNCILLPIEADSQDTALRIFSTLNDRGKPLSDADIFKAEFYKFYSAAGKRDTFIEQWKELEELCRKIFPSGSGTPMDELFTRYMYYVRAKQGNKSSSIEALRKFYEKNNYALLKKESTFEDLIDLAHFWEDVSNQDENRFSLPILKCLFVLNYAPNGMWTYLVSAYFMHNKDQDGKLDDNAFFAFLNKITGFIWSYTVTNPGVNSLRTPVVAEMVNIVNDRPVTFAECQFSGANLKDVRETFASDWFSNNRPITKSMAVWWAFQDDEQELLSLETVFEIEHIYSRSRKHQLRNTDNIESLGNKALLEKRINIRASDYKFSDKAKYYLGSRNRKKEGTKVHELADLANKANDFTEEDIVARCKRIVEAFVDFLKKNDLVK